MFDSTRSRRNADKLQREAEALRNAKSIPPLEAKPTPGMQDWTREIGVLYGKPAKTANGWRIEICPTVQQKELLDNERGKMADLGEYSADVLKGRPAVSIDKGGKARALTITDGSRGIYYDMYDNATVVCETRARRPEVAERTKAQTAHEQHGNPPTPRHRPTFTQATRQTSTEPGRDTSHGR